MQGNGVGGVQVSHKVWKGECAGVCEVYRGWEGRREGEERVCKPGHELQDPSDTASKCFYNFWKGISKASSIRNLEHEPGSSSGDAFWLFGPVTFILAAIVTRTTIFRNCKTIHENLPINTRGWKSPLYPREF